jgi:hypothetical protein
LNNVARVYMTFCIQADAGATIFFAIISLAFDRDATGGAVETGWGRTVLTRVVRHSAANKIIPAVVDCTWNGGNKAHKQGEGGEDDLRVHDDEC